MRIVERVTQLRNEEHERLRQAVFHLDTLLREIAEEEDREFARANAPRFDSWGERIDSAPPPPTRRRTIQPVTIAWRPLEDALLGRLDRWEERLLPLCQRWDRGENVEETLREHAIGMMDSRTQIEALMREFRNQVLFWDLLKDPARKLVTALEACDRAEEDEIIPAIIGGIPEIDETYARKSVSSEDIAKNLRAKATPRPPDPPPKSGFGRWFGWGR